MNDPVAMSRMPGERPPRHGLLRQLPLGRPARKRIYRVLRNGSLAHFPEVWFPAGGATLERLAPDEIA